jgi:sulfate transport system substrate-binding protein
LRFERGLGDVAVTCESEVVSGSAGRRVVPASTLLVETPAAVVDVYADRHGVRAEAEAFVDFLTSAEAQEVFARHGFRPVNGTDRGRFPPVADLWTVEDYGGWNEVGGVFFGPGGLFDSVMEEVHGAAS